jgi:hypothetical protein
MLRLFGDLKIDYRKEAEAGRCNRSRPGMHVYTGWFHFVGRILFGMDTTTNLCPDKISDSLSIGFSEASAPALEPFVGRRLVQMDLGLEVPWVLDEPEPE